MGVWLGPRGKPKAKQLPKFTYTGSYELLSSTRQDGTVDWELVLKSSGTLTFQKVVPSIDFFLCGPGANGASAYHNQSTNQYVGGNGGAGGETKSFTGAEAIHVTAGTAYDITIGTTGTATSGFGKSAASGGGVSGGTGAYTNNNIQSGGNSTAGTQGALAFGGTTQYNNGYRYGGSGGGGGSINNIYYTKDASDGGASGGARGGGVSAGANSGGGGGGGTADRPNWSFNGGGSGGSGIIIIRNARS